MKPLVRWLLVLVVVALAVTAYFVFAAPCAPAPVPEEALPVRTAQLPSREAEPSSPSQPPVEVPTPTAAQKAPGNSPAELENAIRLLRTADEFVTSERFREAERMYLEVASTHEGSDQAYSALVGAGNLRLDKFDYASGAVRLYQQARALRPGGPLDDVALWGMVRCYQKLNAPDREKKALEEYLRAHASSAHAPDAQARLSALGPE